MNKQDNTTIFERDIEKENQPKFSFLLRLIKYVFSSAKVMCGIFWGLAICLSILQPLMAFAWGKYIDGVNITFNEGVIDYKHLFSLISFVILYWLIRFISNLLERYLYGGEDIERLSKVQDHRLQEKFQVKLFEKIAKLYPDYLEVPRINEIISRSFRSIGGEWSSLQRGVIIEGYVISAQMISVVIIAVSLYTLHPFLCFLVLFALIPTLYTMYIGNKLNFKFRRDNGKILREADYYQSELFTKEVKILNLFDFFFHKWKTLADEYVVKERKNQINVFWLGMVNNVIYNMTIIGANIFAISLMIKGEITIGVLGASLSLINTLIGNTSQLFSSIANFLSKKNEATQFFELIDLKEQLLKEVENTKTPVGIEAISVQNVSYRYPLTDNYCISNVNLVINKGEKIAFVGENGAGKTTFVKLLSGLLQPSYGIICINGKNVEEMNYISRYNSMAYVFQNPTRYNTFTIADNVFLGDIEKEWDDSRIDEALTFSGFTKVAKNELLGKEIGGTDLSSGQWQKIAIARAYYRNRDFIMLDEPTSNLDPIIETEVLQKYLSLTKGRTVILVTHKISVASLADRIIVFKNGKIVEDGNHETLLQNDGEYTRLYKTQAQWYDR